MSFSQPDQDLIEAAAKAAGIKLTHHIVGGVPMSFSEGADGGPVQHWNPLNDDGDALRLAVKLRLDVHFELNGPCMSTPIVEVMDGEQLLEAGRCFCAMEDCTADPYAATRRAIVCSAADLARSGKAASGSIHNARSD